MRSSRCRILSTTRRLFYGSWVTNIWRMEELVERIVRWGIRPDKLITHRFGLDEVSEAYALMASGKCGKVAVVFDEESEKIQFQG